MGGVAAKSCVAITTGGAVSRPPKTSETVARGIVADIVGRSLETGDRLPTEAAMLAQYKVSRESLREGLRLLEVQGLINIRRGPGGGPAVGHLDPANLGRSSSLYFHLAGGTYAELLEAWSLSEVILAERAARNDDRDAVITAMEPYTFGNGHDEIDVERFVHIHGHFHAVVASLASNRVLEIMLQTVGQIVTNQVVVRTDPRQVREASTSAHVDIAKAISAGHANKASLLMADHIAEMSDFYRDQLGYRLDDYIAWQ